MTFTLTLVVPCFNSAEYMRRCIDSLLTGSDDVEIIIVDDGSTDATLPIAKGYARRFPTVVRTLHQPNGGHGAAVNAGIKAARGTYVKIVDSDDWLAPRPYSQLMEKLREFVSMDKPVDLVLANFVYETENKKHKRVNRYTNCLPVNRIFTWEDIGHFRLWQYLLMHSLVYRTEVLRDCGLKLPRHTFYVDNLYAFIPLPSVKTLYYLDIDLYRYFIGRDDQSVNESVMIKRIDQQVSINREMFSYFSGIRRDPEIPVQLLRYMAHYLEVITLVSSILMVVSEDPELLVQKEQLWDDFFDEDPVVAGYLRRRFFGHLVNIPGRLGRKATSIAYRGANRVIGFN